MSEQELLQAMWRVFGDACLDSARKGLDANLSDAMRAVLDVLHANGYRRCAEGQRVTQWCDRAEEAGAEVELLRKDYHHACATVAQLYAAATGRHGEGPLRGVIEDAAAVCSERDALRAEVERLRASCDDYASHKQRQDERIIELQAEVERLRYDHETEVQRLTSERDAFMEMNERLTADLEALRARVFVRR